MACRVVFFTGGVYSSVGKGLSLANIGLIFQELGFSVTTLKFDPYLNLNAGNLSPMQHGEVYVTKDGFETDLDLGHYERFMGITMCRLSCVTAGTIFKRVLDRQNSTEYSGETIQVVPHLIDEIHASINALLEKNPNSDFLFVEIGGTVGDLESKPFLEAARRFKKKYLKKHTLFIHISPLIYLAPSHEFKSKPTQHSLRVLASYSINPDLLILRTLFLPSEDIKSKISIVSQLEPEDIFFCVDTNIYLIAENFYEAKIHELILSKLDIPFPDKKLDTKLLWTNKIKAKKTKSIKLALVAKYSTIIDSYISISESFKLAAYDLGIDLEIDCLDVEKEVDLSGYQAVCVPYGFGQRGVEGKIRAIEFCRVNKIPFLGICFGMQLACIEFARNVLNKKDAHSVEIDPSTSCPLFIPIPNKKMRLGAKDVSIFPNTLAHKVFAQTHIKPRHRHRYYLNPDLISIFKDTDFIISGESSDARVIEVIELKNHPFFLAVQFHPEFDTTLKNISPVFVELLRAGLNARN